MKATYHHGRLKEALIDVAMDFIAEKGVEKLTLKVLAEGTGTTRSAIYKHFANKEALIEAVIVEGLDKFDAEVTEMFFDEKRSLMDRFYLAGKAYITFAKKNPNLYKLIFGDEYAHLREALFSLKDDSCSSFFRLKCTVEEAQEKGVFKKENAELQAIAIWSSLHGLSMILIGGFMEVHAQDEDAFDTIFATLLLGMASSKVKLISTVPFINRLLEVEK